MMPHVKAKYKLEQRSGGERFILITIPFDSKFVVPDLINFQYQFILNDQLLWPKMDPEDL